MSNHITLAAMLFTFSLCVGCASNTEEPEKDTMPVSILFLDIDSSDKKISKAMSDKKDTIEVTFGGNQVTTVNIPERLQYWLSATEDSGQGIVLRDANGMQTKDLFSLLSLIPAGIQFAKDAYQSRLVKPYTANIFLSDLKTGIIEKIVFER